MRRILPLLAAALALACSSEEKQVPVAATVGSNATLSAEVEVLYDGLGIPHIYAKSDADAAYAHGYVQARDRFFQMDFQRRAARGRLSELLGSAALSTDVQARTIFTAFSATGSPPSSSGSWRIEDVITEQLSPGLKPILQAYAAGVNRWIADVQAGQNGARLPAEHALLQIPASALAPWTVEDTVAIGRLLTWELSSDLVAESDAGIVAATLQGGGAAGVGMLIDLMRLAPAVNSFILPTSQTPLAPSAISRLPPGAAAALASVAAARDATLAVVPRFKTASNNWTVGPGRTASGNALLANDPHLGLTSPSIWHMVQIVTPTRDVAGVAFAGAPVVPIGHNGKIAFGDTVVGYDVTDVYLETTTGSPPDHALVKGASVAIVNVPETIHVKGAADAHPVVQVIPGHGPVVGASGNKLVSFRWTGHEPSQEIQAFYDVDAATTVDDAVAAYSRSFQVGAQNFIVADTQGHIAYDPHAYVPVRGTGSCAQLPWLPIDATDGSCEWTGRIPDDQLPKLKDPPAGFIATANNDIDGSTIQTQLAFMQQGPMPARYLYASDDLGYRHARIVERLRAKTGGYTLDDMTSIQADDTSLFAKDLVPNLVALLDSRSADLDARGLRAARDLLASWTYTTPTGLTGSDPLSAPATDSSASESEAAALFHALVPRLARHVLDDDLGPYELSVNALVGQIGDQFLAKYLVAAIGTAAGHPPTIPLATGTALCTQGSAGSPCSQDALDALDETVRFLAEAWVFATASPGGWRWGRLHRLVLESPLAAAGFHSLDLGPYANDGGLHTVNVANFDWSDDGSAPGSFDATHGFIQRAGPSVRFAAELAASGVRWRAVITGGEVDYPGDPHRADQQAAWLAHQPGDQPYTRAEVEAQTKDRILFER